MNHGSKRPLVSVVIPVYNEEDCLPELVSRLREVMSGCEPYDFECLMVENGSSDASMELLAQAHESDPRFKVIQLSRNFRMDGALTAGLEVARGDCCVLMAADLQDPPELITDFISLWETGYENVFGIVRKRPGTRVSRRVNSSLFYFVASRLTGGVVVEGASDFRLVDRRVYEAVREMRERNRFVRGLFAWSGFRSVGVPFDRSPRFAGESKAFFREVSELAFKGIFAHSYVPLRWMAILGASATVTALIFLVGFAFSSVLVGVPFPGFGTLLGVVVLGFGLLLLAVGLMAEYLALVYEEVKQRPNFIVRGALGLDDGSQLP